MHYKATDVSIILLLLLITTAVGYVAFNIRHLSDRSAGSSLAGQSPLPPGKDVPRDGENAISEGEYRSPQHNTTGSEQYTSTNLEGDLIDPLTLPLNEIFDVTGSVADEFGNPVQFAVIQVSSVINDVQRSTHTSADGKFFLEGLQQASDYYLEVKSEPRYAAFEAYDLTLARRLSDWNITLQYVSRTSLQGSIVDQLGNPISELKLLVVSDEWSGNTARIASDYSGKYELKNFIPGRINLRSVSSPSIMVHGLALQPDEINYRDLVVDIGSQQLFGIVHRDDGVPVAGVDVRMRFVERHEDGYSSRTVRTTRTDSAGEFRFTGLGSGFRKITFSADGFSRHWVELDPSLNPGPHSITLSNSEFPHTD